MASARLLMSRIVHGLGERVDAAYRAFDVVRSELLVAAVRPEEWRALTEKSYGKNALFRSAQHNARFFEWERACVERYFPAPPGRVLVGGAGGGRELAALAALGYDVAGFEPAAPLVEHARTWLAMPALLGFEVAGYEEFVRGLGAIERFAPFGAVVLGWGSLGHVGEARVRLETLRKARALCPGGPVLLSWVQAKPEGARRNTLRRILSGFGLRRVSNHDSYRAHMGFIHELTTVELDDLARRTGYRVVEVGEVAPYAVLTPAP